MNKQTIQIPLLQVNNEGAALKIYGITYFFLDKQLISLVQDLFLAGSDTTSNSIGNASHVMIISFM